MRMFLALVFLAAQFAAGSALAKTADKTAQKAAAYIEDAALWELEEKDIPSIAVAIVGTEGVLWSRAYGRFDADGKTPAKTDGVYRAGSISKLFTDLAIMQFVEVGKLDLDAPVSDYLPYFKPENSFGGELTLRNMMTHRSGLIREPLAGHYFDTEFVEQEKIARSLSGVPLVAAPGEVTKYSNAAITVLGEVVAAAAGESYDEAVREKILAPLGMEDSGFLGTPFGTKTAYAEMASFDGARFAAPQFELSMLAAGNLYTTLDDLGAFARAMLRKGEAPEGRLIGEEALEEMWTPQFPDSDGPGRNFGLGFIVGDINGERVVGHSGAVYGYASDLRIMPDAGYAVIVFSTVDIGNSANKLADYALRTILTLKTDDKAQPYAKPELITGKDAKALSGWFTDGKTSVATRIFKDHLVIDAPPVVGDVRRLGDQYIVEDVHTLYRDIAFAEDGSWVEIGGVRYDRAAQTMPPLPDEELASLIGEYGWEHNFIRVFERDGRPFARVEWVDYAELKRVGPDHYVFTDEARLYPKESLRFERNSAGEPVAAILTGIRFPRRDFGAEVQEQIRSVVKTGADDLRAEAMKASPPQEKGKAKSDLVALTEVDPSIELDIRYAGENNFMGVPLYESAEAYMQRPAAEAVGEINQVLRKRGYGLLIHDAYRPWFVTKMFWDATPDAMRMFVANPANGSRHNRGAAVDLTMFDLETGEPVAMTGRYDEFSSRSYSNFVGGTDRQRWLRELLRSAMEAQGFDVYSEEWWHFDYGDWARYPINNVSFEELHEEN